MYALSIQNLSKQYANGHVALDNVSLQVKEGDFFGLLGPNGAGKSTLIGILTSIVKKTSGKVSVFDKNIDVDFPAARSLLGVVPQEFNFNLFEKVWQVLVFQAGYYGVNRKTALGKVEELLSRLGLHEQRNSSVRMLSGGMKRRLMIARALIHSPRLLILDEPTAGVDVELRHLTWKFVDEINKNGVTIILTTHYLEEAENLCKNIAIIDNGKIIENTSTKNLLRQLDNQTIELELSTRLKSPPVLNDFSIELSDATTLKIQCSRKADINSLFTMLSKKKIKVIGMLNRSARLEELFVKITGKG